MNVLEKILEELDIVERIIRSHMGEATNTSGKRLIDANALDDEVMNFFLAITGNPKQATVVRECKESFRRMIDEQPTVYADDNWISVSERLPEKSGYYIASIYDDEDEEYRIEITWFHRKEDEDDESEWCELYDCQRVKAWLPLPEPYKGE